MASVMSSQSMKQFCEDRASSTFEKELVSDANNLMAFANRGGIVNSGVCWWHSRFQRNSLYLTYFSPEKERPSREEAKKIIDKIRSAEELVEIPGFRNFNEFSKEHSRDIQKELNKWQRADGIIKFNWLIGLAGRSKVKAHKLERMMDRLYKYVEIDGNIAYQKLQIKGIVSHAWLVIGMKKFTDGYDLEVLDSNSPFQTMSYSYRYGQRNLSHYEFGNFVPYLGRKGEMQKLKLAVLKKCDLKTYKIRKLEKLHDDDKEDDFEDE